MIIFDEPYSNAFLWEAERAGYATPYGKGSSAHKHPYLRVLLQRGLNPSLRREALWHLLLFAPCCIAPVDNLDLRKLHDAQLLKEPEGVFSDTWHAEDSLKKQPDIVRGIRALLRNDLKRSKDKINNNQVDKAIDFYISLRKSGTAKDFLKLSAVMGTDRFTTYRQFIDKIADVLPFDDDQHENSFRRSIQEELSRSMFENIRSNPIESAMYDKIHSRSVHWLHLLAISTQLNAPIKTNVSARGQMDLAQYSSTGREVSIVLRIYFEEITVQPNIRGLDDVLKLRKDRFFADFRETIINTADAYRKGNADEIERFKRELGNFNVRLKSISRNETRSRLMALIAVPADLLLHMWSGAPPVVTSSIGAISALEGYLKIPDRWLLFGRT